MVTLGTCGTEFPAFPAGLPDGMPQQYPVSPPPDVDSDGKVWVGLQHVLSGFFHVSFWNPKRIDRSMDATRKRIYF